jgi:hypothetical protein
MRPLAGIHEGEPATVEQVNPARARAKLRTLGGTKPLGAPDKMRQAIDRAFSEAPDHPEITQDGETGL